MVSITLERIITMMEIKEICRMLRKTTAMMNILKIKNSSKTDLIRTTLIKMNHIYQKSNNK